MDETGHIWMDGEGCLDLRLSSSGVRQYYKSLVSIIITWVAGFYFNSFKVKKILKIILLVLK